MVQLKKISKYIYEVPKEKGMKVPGRIFASEKLMADIKEDKTLEQVKNVEEAFLDGQVPEIENLKKAIEKHAEFEDKVFYPKLDENLNPQQKQEIIDRIKEVIRE